MALLPEYVSILFPGQSESFDPAIVRTEMERGLAKQASDVVELVTTRKNWQSWKLAVLLILPVLQACSATSAPPQPAVRKLQVTPLPVEISQISISDSRPWLERAEQWLQALQVWSGNGTLK